MEVPGQEDDELFDETLEAMEIMGFTEEERLGTLTVHSHPPDSDLILCAPDLSLWDSVCPPWSYKRLKLRSMSW